MKIQEALTAAPSGPCYVMLSLVMFYKEEQKKFQTAILMIYNCYTFQIVLKGRREQSKTATCHLHSHLLINRLIEFVCLPSSFSNLEEVSEAQSTFQTGTSLIPKNSLLNCESKEIISLGRLR